MATISKYQTSSGAMLYRVRYRTPANRQTDKRGFTSKREAARFAATVEVSKLQGRVRRSVAGADDGRGVGSGVAGPPARAPQAVQPPVGRD